MTAELSALRRAIELVGVPLMLLSVAGEIQQFNQAAERLLGRTTASVRGRHVNAILPDDLQTRTEALLAATRQSGEMHGVFPVLHADGTQLPLEVSATVFPSTTGSQGWIVATALDLSPLLDDIEQLSASALGLSAETHDDLLLATTEAARKLIGSRYAALGVVEDGRLVRFIPDGMSEAQIAAIDHLPEGRGLLGAMVSERQTTRLADLGADPRSSGFPAGHPPMASFLGTPIQLEGEVLGHLYFTDKLDAPEFSIIDERMAELFAAHAAVAIRDQRRRRALETTLTTLWSQDVDLARQATILGHVRDSVIVTDMAGSITYWNRGAEQIFGYAADEMIGQTAAVLYPEQDMSGLAPDLGRIMAGEDYVGEWLGRHKDGTLVWIDIRTTLMRDPAGDPGGFIGIGHDITARKLTEGALRGSERSLAEAQHIAHLGSWEREVATGVLRWSEESHRIFGIEPGTFAGTVEDFRAFVHPDDRARAAPSPAELAAGDPESVEYRIIRPDGAVRTLHEEAAVIRDATGAPIRYVGTTQDITDRVAAEARQSRLARLLDDVSSEIYVFDAGTLRFSEANAGALRNLGYSLDELRELTPLDLKPAHTQASFARLLTPLRRGKREQVAFSTIHRRKDGSTYPVEVRLDLLAAETPPVFVAVIQDISDRVAAEAERARLVSAVEQTADSIVIYKPDLTITYVNPSFSRLYGYVADQVIGQRGGVLGGGRHDDAFWSEVWATVSAGRVWTGSIVNRRKGGALVEVESVITPVRDAAGQITSYVQTDRDVTHERALESALERDARERETIEAALERIDPSASVEEIASAACAEIVGLEGIDSAWAIGLGSDYGHILAEVGLIGRVLTAGTSVPDARSDYLRERAARGPWAEEWRVRPEDGSYGEMISASGLHTAVYAPLKGAHGVIGVIGFGAHDPANADRIVERLPALATFASIVGALLAPGLETRHREDDARADVRSILDAGAFSPFFQPIVELHSGRVVGYEALSRFADGGRPDLVFALAARSGLGLELETATLQAAVAASAVLPPDAHLSLNVSPVMILSGGLPALLTGHARPFVLEITEHVVVEDYAALQAGIKALGPDVRLAVDDAGAGYASLRHILELKPDFVKLDLGLVRGINRDQARQALIAGIGYFAVKRKVRLIAEGIETPAELKTLLELGVSHGQGYLLGRPQDGRGPGPWPARILLPD